MIVLPVYARLFRQTQCWEQAAQDWPGSPFSYRQGGRIAASECHQSRG
jgi:hypothetical protein